MAITRRCAHMESRAVQRRLERIYAKRHDLSEPTKQQLRDMLAEAARNTAALPIPPEIEEFDKAMRPLVKGRRP